MLNILTSRITARPGFLQKLLCRHEMEHLANRFDFKRWETQEVWVCRRCETKDVRNHSTYSNSTQF